MAIKHKADVQLPELVFTGGGDLAADRKVLRLAGEGRLLKLYQGVYTSNLDSPPETVVLRHWANIVSHLLPQGVLSYRSGFDAKPVGGFVYVTRGNRLRTLDLPGLSVKVIPGPGAVEGDAPYKNLFLASQARWLLENMATGRGVSERVLAQEAIEIELDKLLSIRGEYRFNQLRDACRTLAAKLGREKEFKRLDGIMGALLGTHESKKLHGKQALARAAGRPHDPDRLKLFDMLFSCLRTEVLPEAVASAEAGVARENFAFFESYFSNYIEGTTFLVSEAEEIVFGAAERLRANSGARGPSCARADDHVRDFGGSPLQGWQRQNGSAGHELCAERSWPLPHHCANGLSRGLPVATEESVESCRRDTLYSSHDANPGLDGSL